MRNLNNALLAGAVCAMAAWSLPAAAQAQSVAAPASGVSDQAIDDFVQSHAAVTRIQRIARWEDGICLSLTGLPAQFGKFVTERVRKVAATAGAPIDTGASCRPNIDIVFTAKPQALLDNIRATTPTALGFYNTSAQADHLATITRPIQAWYVTETRDLRGQPQIDSRDNNTASAQNVTGNRITDGLRSAFHHVLIVADPGKLGTFEIGSISDQVALLALSQPASPDACQDLPSITNMTTPDCHAPALPTAMTAGDTAYLHALYAAKLGVTLPVQIAQIAAAMKDVLR